MPAVSRREVLRYGTGLGAGVVAAGYASLPARFPDGVDFTAGVDDPATGWPYIHPGPDDDWLVVFVLDTHNTAPGTVDVALNGGPATTVTLDAGSGTVNDAGRSPEPNAVTLTKSGGSWMVYDALGVYA